MPLPQKLTNQTASYILSQSLGIMNQNAQSSIMLTLNRTKTTSDIHYEQRDRRIKFPRTIRRRKQLEWWLRTERDKSFRIVHNHVR